MPTLTAQIAQRVRQLAKLGVKGRALADAMGISEATLHRLAHPKKGQEHDIRASSLEGFERYRLQLLHALRPTQAGDSQREQALAELVDVAAQLATEDIRETVEQLRHLLRKLAAQSSSGGQSSGRTQPALPGTDRRIGERRAKR